MLFSFLKFNWKELLFLFFFIEEKVRLVMMFLLGLNSGGFVLVDDFFGVDVSVCVVLVCGF